MLRAILTIGACLLLAGFTVAGCGGGSGGGSTAQSSGSEATNADTGTSAGGEEGASAESKKEQLAEEKEEQLAIESGAARKQGFLAKAETLCREQRKEMLKRTSIFLEKAKSAQAGEATQRSFVEEVIAPGFEAEAEGLRALPAPKGDEEEVEALIAAIEKSVAEARKDPKTYLADEKVAKADDLATAYGLLACGNFAS